MANKKKNIEEFLKDYDVFIFDVDGTLYHIFYLLLNFVVLFFKHPFVAINFYRARKGYREITWPDDTPASRESFLDRQAGCAGKSAQYFNTHMYRYVNERAVKLRAFKGVREVLSILKMNGKKNYAYSDFPIGNKLEELGVADLFDGAYTSEDSGFLKPDKRGLDYLRDKIELEISRTLFIGDRTSTDFEFARNCNMGFARVGKEWKW